MKQKKILSDSDTVDLNTIDYAERYEELKPKIQIEEPEQYDDSSGEDEDDVIKFDPKIINNDPVSKNKEVKFSDDVASGGDDVAKEVKEEKKEKDGNANLLLENGAGFGDVADDDVEKDEEESESLHPRKIEGSVRKVETTRQRQIRESKKEREEIKDDDVEKDEEESESLHPRKIEGSVRKVETTRQRQIRESKKEREEIKDDDVEKDEEESESLHPRKIEGSVRKVETTRQRQIRERKLQMVEEIKRLKNVKKKEEMSEKLKEDGLPEGFYYVEAIRKSRTTRKGKKNIL